MRRCQCVHPVPRRRCRAAGCCFCWLLMPPAARAAAQMEDRTLPPIVPAMDGLLFVFKPEASLLTVLLCCAVPCCAMLCCAPLCLNLRQVQSRAVMLCLCAVSYALLGRLAAGWLACWQRMSVGCATPAAGGSV